MSEPPPVRASHPLWAKSSDNHTQCWTSSGVTIPLADPHTTLPNSKSAAGFGAGLFPLHSPLLRESWLVSFPPLIDMLKFSGYSRLIRGQGSLLSSRLGDSNQLNPLAHLYAHTHKLKRRKRRCRRHSSQCTLTSHTHSLSLSLPFMRDAVSRVTKQRSRTHIALPCTPHSWSYRYRINDYSDHRSRLVFRINTQLDTRPRFVNCGYKHTHTHTHTLTCPL